MKSSAISARRLTAKLKKKREKQERKSFGYVRCAFSHTLLFYKLTPSLPKCPETSFRSRKSYVTHVLQNTNHKEDKGRNNSSTTRKKCVSPSLISAGTGKRGRPKVAEQQGAGGRLGRELCFKIVSTSGCEILAFSASRT